jgi:hypothetical protein
MKLNNSSAGITAALWFFGRNLLFLGRMSLVSGETKGVFLGCTLHKPRINSVSVSHLTGEQIRLLPVHLAGSFNSAWAFAV